MRVRAKETGAGKWVGYYNLVRRKAGDVFDLLDDRHFSSKWMEKVDEGVEKTHAPGEPAIADLVADGMVGLAHPVVKKGPGRPRINV